MFAVVFRQSLDFSEEIKENKEKRRLSTFTIIVVFRFVFPFLFVQIHSLL